MHVIRTEDDARSVDSSPAGIMDAHSTAESLLRRAEAEGVLSCFSVPMSDDNMGASLRPEIYLWAYGMRRACPIHCATGTDTAFPKSPHL